MKKQKLQPNSHNGSNVREVAPTLGAEVTGTNWQRVISLGGGAGLPATALGVGEAVGTHYILHTHSLLTFFALFLPTAQKK